MSFTKIIQSGNVLEIYEYEKSLPIRKKIVKFRAKVNREVNLFKRRRKDNIARLSKSFRRLVQANLVGNDAPCMLTLTMREIETIVFGYSKFRLFTQSLRYHFGRDFRYIAVPEFQKRGAVHFHVLLWGLPSIIIENERQTRFIASLWGHGFVDFIKTDGNIKLAGYLAKYMSKTMSEDRLGSQKAYVASRNIMRPVSLSNSMAFELQELIWGVDKLLLYEKTFDTMWLGRCHYKSYNLIDYVNSGCKSIVSKS